MEKFVKKNKIAIIGLSGESNFYRVDRFAKTGETVISTEYNREYGGKGFNQAIAARRFGADVSFLTVLGKDDINQKCQAVLEQEGIKYFIVEKEGKSASAAIIIDKKGDNKVICYTGVSTNLTKKDVKEFEREIAEAKYLLVQLELSDESLFESIKIAKKYDTKIILNPAPAHKIPKEVLDDCYLITPNEEEYQTLFNSKLPLKESIKRKKNVCVTLGSKGSILSFGKTLEIIKPIKVEQVNSTGAGDTYNGILAAALVSGYSMVEACKYASVGAGISTTIDGVIDSIPSFVKIKSYLIKHQIIIENN